MAVCSPTITISTGSLSFRHCHNGNADCLTATDCTISGVFSIYNGHAGDIQLDTVCGPGGTNWLELPTNLGFKDEGGVLWECDSPSTEYWFKLTDNLGVEIDDTVNINIPALTQVDFYWTFGICTCCSDTGALLSLFNDYKFIAEGVKFHIQSPAGCCHVEQDIDIDLCVGDDQLLWTTDGVSVIPGAGLDFDGTALIPGQTVTHDVVIKNDLGCPIDNICCQLEDADGHILDPGVADIIFTGISAGPECPTQASIAPAGVLATYEIEWTIPVSPVDVTYYLAWNYCDIAEDNSDCCDGLSEPRCSVQYRLPLNTQAPVIDCTGCNETATQVSTPETCEGICDGETVVTIGVGCATPFTGTAVWTPLGGAPVIPPADQTDDPALGTSTVVNLCGNSQYRVDFIDGDGCPSSIIFTTPFVDTLNGLLTSDPILCNGDVTNIYCNVDGGTPPYTFAWTASGGGLVPVGQSTNQNLTGVIAGTYEVTITDDNGCSDVKDIIIDEPTPISLSSTIVLPSCLGVCDGSIDLDVSGGTAPYTYEWRRLLDPTWTNPNSGSQDLTDLCIGTYVVDVTDANGCEQNHLCLVPAPTPITSNYVVTDKLCPNSADGDITSGGITGGTGPYTFIWTNPAGDQFATTQDVNLLSLSGQYIVQITDSIGCFIVESYTLGSQNQYTLSTISTQNNVCFGDCLSEIDLTVTGGSGTFSFVWTGPVGFVDPGTEDLTALCAGDYFVTVTDTVVGCVAIQGGPIQITENALLATQLLYSTNLLCHDIGTACVQFAVTGGVAPYSYVWEWYDTVGATWATHPSSVDDKELCLDSSGFIDSGIPEELQLRLVVTDSLSCTTTSDSLTICNPPELEVTCLPTPQSAPGLSDGSASFVIVETGNTSCQATTATLALSTGDIFPGLSNTNVVDVTNKFCQTISWTLTNTLGCQITGTCTIDCPPDPGVEGCCDDPLALNYNCDGCLEPDPDACKYDHITCPVDWVMVDDNPLPDCISAGQEIKFLAAPHFPNRVTCEPVESCCEEYGSAPEWDSVTTYDLGDLVWYADQGDMYRSLYDDNQNFPPSTSPIWWEKCCECGDDPVVDPCYRFAEITISNTSNGEVTILTFTDMPPEDPAFQGGWQNVDWTMCQDFLENIENYPIDYLFMTDGALSSGELTITMKLWDCFEEYECCEKKVVLCKDIRTSQVSCQNWKILDLSPAIGYSDQYPSAEWTEQNKFTLKNYLGTYTETKWDNTGVAVSFVLPTDDVYIVKIERFYVNNADSTITASLWDEPKYVIIYEFCVLLKCVKAIILDIFCSGVDCCAEDCNQTDKEKDASKRYMLNKVVALWSSMLGFIQKDKLKYLDLYYIDSERDVSVNQIGQMIKWLKDMSSKCKPCVDGAEINLENFSSYPTTPAGGTTTLPTPNDDDIIDPDCCD